MRVFALASAAILFSAMPVAASPYLIFLDFEGAAAGNTAQLLEFYNGGTDSEGNSSPDNYGISFTPELLAIRDEDVGGSGNFANEPSPSTILYFEEDGVNAMNVPAGFDALGFWYTSSGPGLVQAWSGLNGTGALLGSFAIAPILDQFDPPCEGDPTGAYCLWEFASLNWPGSAQSVTFRGTVAEIGFDSFSLLFAEDAPAPGSIALFGLAAIALFARRRVGRG